MSTSLFLAKLIGPLYLVIGLGLIVGARDYRALAKEFLHSRALVYLSGLLSLTAGLAIVLAHNVWAADWRVLITVIGWMAAIGGAVRMVLPRQVERIGNRFIAYPNAAMVGAGVTLALGAVLSFFGYVR